MAEYRKADPTTALLDSLDDPAKFVTVRRVPVCVPHKRTVIGPDDKPFEVEVTEDDLPEIAEQVNRAVRETGTPIRVTVGHVNLDPKFPEKDQPVSRGFGRNAVVGRFGPRRKLGVLADLSVRQEHAGVLQDYPERSMDFDPATKRIHGIALLVRRPWLDMGVIGGGLGLTQYQAGNFTVQYGGSAMPADMGDDSPVDEVQYAAFCDRLKKDHPKLAQYMDGAGMAAMGPANGELPAAPGQPAPQVPYQADPAAEAKLLAVQKQLDAERTARIGETARRMLDPLKDARQFNYDYEMSKLVAYQSDEERAAHVQYMAQNYVPLATAGRTLISVADNPKPGGDWQKDPTVAPPGHDHAMQYMRTHGVSYQAALATYRS